MQCEQSGEQSVGGTVQCEQSGEQSVGGIVQHEQTGEQSVGGTIQYGELQTGEQSVKGGSVQGGELQAGEQSAGGFFEQQYDELQTGDAPGDDVQYGEQETGEQSVNGGSVQVGEQQAGVQSAGGCVQRGEQDAEQGVAGRVLPSCEQVESSEQKDGGRVDGLCRERKDTDIVNEKENGGDRIHYGEQGTLLPGELPETDEQDEEAGKETAAGSVPHSEQVGGATLCGEQHKAREQDGDPGEQTAPGTVLSGDRLDTFEHGHRAGVSCDQTGAEAETCAEHQRVAEDAARCQGFGKQAEQERLSSMQCPGVEDQVDPADREVHQNSQSNRLEQPHIFPQRGSEYEQLLVDKHAG